LLSLIFAPVWVSSSVMGTQLEGEMYPQSRGKGPQQRNSGSHER
jgi:hypothetical protein